MEDWLRDAFFDYHRKLYDNRPVYFPLSSAKKSFFALISIHRWTDSTLSTLLAEHLLPEQKALQGALVDLQAERKSPDKKIRSAAEKNYAQHKKWLEELEDFIRKVQEVAEKGPPSPDDKTERREVDFPSRVDEKCQQDPSLAVAHGCFWKYHPEKAYHWELRLQDEIGPDFKLDEKDSDALRAAFLDKQPARARELEAAEQTRRECKARKQDQEELDLSEAEGDEGEDEEAVSA